AVLEGIATLHVTFTDDQRYELEKYWRDIKKKDSPLKANSPDPSTLVYVYPEVAWSEFYGHRTFSYALSDARRMEYPRWTSDRWNPCRWVFGALRRWLVDQYNVDQRNRAYEMMNIESSQEVATDLRHALAKLLVNRPGIARLLFGGNSVFQVHFSYGQHGENPEQRYVGMRMKVLEVSYQDLSEGSFGFSFANFIGYGNARNKRIVQAQVEMRKTVAAVQNSVANAELRHKIETRYVGFFRTVWDIESPETNYAHKWQGLENLYHAAEVEPTYEAMGEFRSIVLCHSGTLLSMTQLLNKFVIRAKELGAPLTFPRILDTDQNVITFTRLWPMHLGDALKKDVVPISGLPALNGTMVGLTGAHGGGKTVTEHTIAANIYLAQSGLPVLGEDFQLNPKTHIGLVFIEGVSGRSVCQLLIEKMTKVFQGIEGIPGNQIVLVLDELGSATQAASGMSLAMRVLSQLHQRHVSLLFSTQISEVAEQAEQQFGARCFQVDRQHRLIPGIGDGQMEALVQEAGLGKYIGKG
ncbi:MAG: hypothetical protein V1916_02110, partial [Patescibacteria group bacterium]